MKTRKLLAILTVVIFVLTCCASAVYATGDSNDMTVEYLGKGIYSVSAAADSAGDTYMFFAANYTEDKSLAGVSVKTISPEEAIGNVVSAEFDLTEISSAIDISKTKFMLWKSSDIRPLAPATVPSNLTGGLVEVAEGKPVGGKGIGGEWSDTSKLLNPSNIVDGNDESEGGFYAKYGTRGHMFIDLGQKYKIDRIDILSYNPSFSKRTGDFNLVLSNSVSVGEPSGGFVAAHVPATLAANAEEAGFRSVFVKNDEAFRYVSLEKFQENDPGLLIAEVKVYVREDDIPEPETYIEVAGGKTVGGKGIGGAWSDTSKLLNGSNIVDGDDETEGGFYANFGTKGHMYIDLGQKYKIDHIDVVSFNATFADRAGDFDIVLSNSVTEGEASGGLVVAHVDAPSSKTTRTYNVYDSGEYRYVSLEKFKDNNVGLSIAEIKVYVKEEDMPAEPQNVALGKTGELARAAISGYDDISVITDGSYCIGGNSKQVITYLGSWFCLDLGDEYEISDVVIDCVSTDFTSQVDVYLSDYPATQATGLPANKTTIIDGAADTAPWDTAVRTITLSSPMTARYVIVYRPAGASGNNLRLGEIEVWSTTPPVKYIEVAQGKYIGGKSEGNYCGTNEYGQFKDLGQHPTLLTDGNYETNMGFYAGFGTTGNMYVDLGIAYKIDHIDILAYNATYPYRAGDCDLIVSNTVNDNAPCTDENKLIVAHVPAATAATAAEASFKSFRLPADAGSYRYVSLEKFQENSYGLLIAEVRVYVKDTDLEFSFDEYMTPVWKGNTVYNESITFIPDPDTREVSPAPLLYTPTEVISVKSYDLQTTYKEGVDYAVEDGKIVLLEGGGMSAWGYDEYYSPDEGYYKIAWKNPEGRYVHFSGGDYQESHQYYVTYKHDGTWEGPVPQYSGSILTKTEQKLQNGEKIRILFNGDSITAGGEASGCGILALRDGTQNAGAVNICPHMPIYPQLVTDKLRLAYPNADIEYLNTSNPGSSSKTGAECAEWWIKAHNADLVVLAWGMNDLSFTAEEHKANIETMIDNALEANPGTEFILVATMLPNPGSSWGDNHLAEFMTVYEEIKAERSGVNIAIAPMTAMHQYLLGIKRDADMSANGINHPNDFLQRIYAQTLTAMLISEQ